MTSSITGAAARGWSFPFFGRMIRKTKIAVAIKITPIIFNMSSIQPYWLVARGSST